MTQNNWSNYSKLVQDVRSSTQQHHYQDDKQDTNIVTEHSEQETEQDHHLTIEHHYQDDEQDTNIVTEHSEQETEQDHHLTTEHHYQDDEQDTNIATEHSEQETEQDHHLTTEHHYQDDEQDTNIATEHSEQDHDMGFADEEHTSVEHEIQDIHHQKTIRMTFKKPIYALHSILIQLLEFDKRISISLDSQTGEYMIKGFQRKDANNDTMILRETISGQLIAFNYFQQKIEIHSIEDIFVEFAKNFQNAYPKGINQNDLSNHEKTFMNILAKHKDLKHMISFPLFIFCQFNK